MMDDAHEGLEILCAAFWRIGIVLSCDIDLLHPPAELEKQRHKLKRLVASPNSYFMDVKCQVLPYLATLRRSWSALAATQSSAFPLVARPGSWRDALSGERETKMGT
ncbi:hypothetical protein KSW81_001465 [Nannochloris sp. 'desiccata']|nr:hypothetical protein KSW81_001465 [Chlorella desiccata (nom. nud.)]